MKKVPTKSNSIKQKPSLTKPSISLSYLSCPQCKQSIPSINKYIISPSSPYELSLSLSCSKCSFSNKTFKLSSINKSSKDSVSFMTFCPSHNVKAISYQYSRCNENICEKCTYESHRQHPLLTYKEYYNEIDVKLPFHSMEQYEKYSKEVIVKNQQYKQILIDKINRKILEYSNTKKEIEASLEKNTTINKNLIDFLKVLYHNYLNSNASIQIIENFNHICQINKNNFSIESSISSSIEYLSSSLISFYNTNYIIHPYHIFSGIVFDGKGHKSGISALIQLSHSENPLITGSLDKTIKIWESKRTYSCIKTLEGHSRAINVLCEFHNGYVGSASSDSTVIIWDVINFIRITTVCAHSSFVFGLIQLTDKRIVTASDDCDVIIWSSEFKKLGKIEFAKEAFCVIEIKSDDPSRKRIAVGLGDNFIWLCYVNNKYFDVVQKDPLTGHKGSVRTLATMEDGRLLSGSNDNTIKVWDVMSKLCLLTLEEHYLYLNSITQLRDGRVVSASFDDTVKVWNKENFKCLSTLTGHRSFNVVIEMIDGRIATGSSDNYLSLWY